MRQKRKFGHLRNKRNRKFYGDEEPGPSSYKSYKDESYNQKAGYRSDNDLHSQELNKKSTSEVPPYNDSKDIAEENL